MAGELRLPADCLSDGQAGALQLNSGVRPQQTLMLDDRLFAQLSPLARRFRAEFAEQLSHVVHVETFTDRYELVIPAAHDEVGPLHVRDDGDELTISVGAHHWHVPLYMYEDDPEDERVALAAAMAVTNVRDVLEHRTILRITRSGWRIASTMSYNIDYEDVSPATANDREYVWSGPRVRGL